MLGTLCLYWRPDILQLLPWEHGRPDHPITRVRPRPQGWACNQSRSHNTSQQPLWKKSKQYSELMYACEKFRHCMRMFAILLLGNNATTIRPSWITLIEAKEAVQMYICQCSIYAYALAYLFSHVGTINRTYPSQCTCY